MKSKNRLTSPKATSPKHVQPKNINLDSATKGFENKNSEFVFFEERIEEKMSMINVKELLENYLAEGKILIAIDSNVEGVVLPDHLMNSIQVKLNLSYRFATNIFEIDEEKVRIDLSFSGSRFLCVIPFTSIYYVAMAEDPLNGVEVVEHMPIELLELSYQLETQAEKNKEIENKQIDFLSNIPIEKAMQIEKNIEISPKKSKSSSRQKSSSSAATSNAKKELEDKLFDDFMKLVAEYEIQDQLRDISSKLHNSHKNKPASRNNNKKKKADNEIDFTQYLDQSKDQKQ
jgi:stringent starvation protein B